MDLFVNPGEVPEEESEENVQKPTPEASSGGVRSLMRRRD